MPIPNFSFLVEQALKGDSEAIKQWYDYSEHNTFSAEEVAEASVKLDNAILSINPTFKSHALLLKGIWHYFGVEGIEDTNQAIICYEHAIVFNNSYAMVLRALLYEEGIGGKDMKKAISLYKKAIRLGNSEAMLQYADIHQASAIKYYLYAIKAGNSTALVNFALINELGTGIRNKDIAKAIELYDKAIELGDPEAMNHRARLYELGIGGEKNIEKAVALYDRAIALNHPKAIWNKVHLRIHEMYALNMEYIRLREMQLNKILLELAQKIKKIDPDRFTESLYVANNLVLDLHRAKEHYVKTFKERQKGDSVYIFEKECEKLIEKARPVLERDLGWGPYLTNLLKNLVNFMINTCTLGKVKTFFPLAKAELIEAVDEAKNQISYTSSLVHLKQS